MNKDLDKLNIRLDQIDLRLNDAVLELGYVLKAIEELSVEKRVFSRQEIQNRIIHLTAVGWVPESYKTTKKKEA